VLSANGSYAGITKGEVDGKSQVDLLLRHCLRRSERLKGSVWPLYCFYNSWAGGWPENVASYQGQGSYTPSPDELRRYGCAAANAWSVKRILIDRRYSRRRTLRDSYLPVSRPWSLIFPDYSPSVTPSSREILNSLASWLPGRRQLMPTYPPDGVDREPDILRWRGRLAVYTDPAPISRPPDYVFDLLEGGKARPRRLKPLGRRVVILPELT
jgi:hypothetical protein